MDITFTMHPDFTKEDADNATKAITGYKSINITYNGKVLNVDLGAASVSSATITLTSDISNEHDFSNAVNNNAITFDVSQTKTSTVVVRTTTQAVTTPSATASTVVSAIYVLIACIGAALLL